jgi:hypothetical protein
VFHVSQLKPFTIDYSPVYSKLPDIPTLDVADVIPERILDRRLVKKGNLAVTQILVQWNRLPESSATWEDFNVLKQRFPLVAFWGQIASSEGAVSWTQYQGDQMKGGKFDGPTLMPSLGPAHEQHHKY